MKIENQIDSPATVRKALIIMAVFAVWCITLYGIANWAWHGGWDQWLR